jgi:hypothetical protein
LSLDLLLACSVASFRRVVRQTILPIWCRNGSRNEASDMPQAVASSRQQDLKEGILSQDFAVRTIRLARFRSISSLLIRDSRDF